MLPDLGRLKSWGARGALALSDQGLFSGANFVINILLARWLDPEAYGAFAVSYSILLFLAGFHNSLLMEPMSIFGPARYPDSLPKYLSRQTTLHFIITVPLAVALLAAGVGLTWKEAASPMGPALLGAGLAFPFILLLYTTRRFQYILKFPSRAVMGSGFYLALGLAGLIALRRSGGAGLLTAYAIMAIASVLPSVVLVWTSRTGKEAPTRVPESSALMKEQWDFGRWQLASGILLAAGTQAQMYLAAGLLGLKSAGALRAMEMGMLPMSQTILAIGVLALPILSYEYGQGDLKAMRRKGLLITGVLTAIACVYEGILIAACGPLERLLFGGKFAEHAWLIPVFGAVPILGALATGPMLMLKAAQRPRFALVQAVIVAPVGLVSGVLLTKAWGLLGTAVSLVSVSAVSAVIVYCLCLAWIPRQAGEGAAAK